MYRLDEQGLTLVEVMIALVILTVAVLGMVSMFSSGVLFAQQAGDNTRALNFAQGKLEELKVTANLSAGVTQGQEGDFSYTLTIEQDATYAGLFSVQMEVYYPTANGSGGLSLATLMWER